MMVSVDASGIGYAADWLGFGHTIALDTGRPSPSFPNLSHPPQVHRSTMRAAFKRVMGYGGGGGGAASQNAEGGRGSGTGINLGKQEPQLIAGIIPAFCSVGNWICRN